MSRDDWFRNTTWNESLEKAFEAKLRRARSKSQYLRIQASHLRETHPIVALRLLERYFGLGDKFDWAQAYCDQANAFLCLGRIDDAIASYKKALAREAEYPNVKTQAYIDLPFVIVTRSVRARFDEAEQLLRDHQSRLTFPVDRFMWHAALALIAKNRGNSASASEHASRALVEASHQESGFRYHPTIGLVPERYRSLVEELTPLSNKPLH